ncbi:uncharacterized mitochondrial protein AtMg00810-like [Lycium barbarum]|uniref:uncharacterized mitochondrial protein AtMg00810-like n=1 Tax=Lycium barbarum TaxID=112863 RepID=UPI00293EB3FC|nr:uncharacterized mitochondrial protein AtMg00810-like [Lycium barbarum]
MEGKENGRKNRGGRRRLGQRKMKVERRKRNPSDDHEGIAQLKQHLSSHFQTEDLGRLKYFLGIEVAQSGNGIAITQRKYALRHFGRRQWEPLKDPSRYCRLIGKLNYRMITRPDMSFVVSGISQFLQSPCDSHWNTVSILRYIKSSLGQGLLYEDKRHTHIVGYSDADWAGSPSDRQSTSDYCVLI